MSPTRRTCVKTVLLVILPQITPNKTTVRINKTAQKKLTKIPKVSTTKRNEKEMIPHAKTNLTEQVKV